MSKKGVMHGIFMMQHIMFFVYIFITGLILVYPHPHPHPPRRRRASAMSVCFFSTTPHRVTSTAAASSFSRPLHCQTYPSFHHCGFGHHFRYHVPPIKFLATPWMSRARLIGVLKESSEVETDDRQRAPASDQEELEEAADGVVANGVVAETSKEGSDLVRKVPVRSKRKIDEEEDEYDRYTLRNGREVCIQSSFYLLFSLVFEFRRICLILW